MTSGTDTGRTIGTDAGRASGTDAGRASGTEAGRASGTDAGRASCTDAGGPVVARPPCTAAFLYRHAKLPFSSPICNPWEMGSN